MATNSIRDDFNRRVAVLRGVNADELGHRLAGLIGWMEQEATLKLVIDSLRAQVDVAALMQKRRQHPHVAPPASSFEEIARVGLMVMDECLKGTSIHTVAYHNGLAPFYDNLTEKARNILETYIVPLLQYIEQSLPPSESSKIATGIVAPPIIKESLEKFQLDHPDTKKVCFLMMKFGKTRAHDLITEVVGETFSKFGLEVLRADEREYHEDLFPNVQTYMHGCGFGIAILERIEAEEFNPNVSLEIGYMLAQRKPVLLLKDSTLKNLHTDLVGKLYRPFDFQNPHETIPPQLKSWLEDKGLI